MSYCVKNRVLEWKNGIFSKQLVFWEQIFLLGKGGQNVILFVEFVKVFLIFVVYIRVYFYIYAVEFRNKVRILVVVMIILYWLVVLGKGVRFWLDKLSRK